VGERQAVRQAAPVFVEDGIHLNDVGRKEWTRVIKPLVDKEAVRKDACR